MSRTSWFGLPLPLDLTPIGMTGCTLHTGVDMVVALTANQGVASWAVPIPADPGLVGSTLFQQALIVDQGANALGVTTSNAGEVRIGAR